MRMKIQASYQDWQKRIIWPSVAHQCFISKSSSYIDDTSTWKNVGFIVEESVAVTDILCFPSGDTKRDSIEGATWSVCKGIHTQGDLLAAHKHLRRKEDAELP